MIVSISCEVTPYIPGAPTTNSMNKIQRIKQVREIFNRQSLSLKNAKDLVECIMAHGKARINVTEGQFKALQDAGYTCSNVDFQEIRFNDATYYQNRKLEAISAVCVGEWNRAIDIISELKLLDGEWDALNDNTNLNFLIAQPLKSKDE